MTVVGVLLLGGAYFAMRSTAPDEKDRVKHGAGFSVVHPPGWNVTLMSLPGHEPVRMNLAPAKYVGDSPSMAVTRLPAPVDAAQLQADGFVRETFQGAGAWVRRRFNKRALDLSACVERSGSWFRFDLYLPGLEAAKEEEYRPYLQSLRVESKPAATTKSLSPPATAAVSDTAAGPATTSGSDKTGIDPATAP